MKINKSLIERMKQLGNIILQKNHKCFILFHFFFLVNEITWCHIFNNERMKNGKEKNSCLKYNIHY